jgi:hypothetical protein
VLNYVVFFPFRPVVGIFVNTTDSVSTTTRRGMNILPSADLEMFCTLPASFVIVVALPTDLREMLEKKSSRRNNKNDFSDSDDSEHDSDGEEEEEGEEGGHRARKVSVQESTSVDLLGLGSEEEAPAPGVQEQGQEQDASGYEWIGYSKIDDAANGPGSELCMLLDSFLTTLPGGTTHFRMCFSFADRMSRDAFALSCRVLAGIKPGMWLECNDGEASASLRITPLIYVVLCFIAFHGIQAPVIVTACAPCLGSPRMGRGGRWRCRA